MSSVGRTIRNSYRRLGSEVRLSAGIAAPARLYIIVAAVLALAFAAIAVRGFAPLAMASALPPACAGCGELPGAHAQQSDATGRSSPDGMVRPVAGGGDPPRADVGPFRRKPGRQVEVLAFHSHHCEQEI
ncbi:hypothetical protein [Labrys monachus]|uniref:Uncharacterized protein n=1 Tax=Labrys monachus TaxID=217067 RepID=A0ABU0F6U6_9HYPH|nr:hypothetical protein [Labrys monachus]MDQ0390337.1 hypothetical protein [Labrys monachus]